MKLSPTMQKYVLHWGEMGTRWGVNRTVAQLHALLYLSNQPLHAEELQETLGVARSNISNSLKELQSWGLVKVVHVIGDRRDHFVALQDVWEIFRVIMEERKKREIDPTLTIMRECVMDAEKDEDLGAETRQKMENVLQFLEMLTNAYEDFRHIPPSRLQRLIQMGGKVVRFLGGGKASKTSVTD
ncbi:GbsR/MarR family transcriptional regulator [Leeia sp. TBRC 13508]|uniref:HTH-type transcriptional regulator n=1 Tax=Leeia speluncae TaxID=2884804 RepID=A0ABS8D420_9NEIS|nr:GbsR/MarR family transcriptional regulator [Leeia speluncae]MCB6182940.1 GbsR/MarR family transcriptional regulator [Leeia speluncae]